MTTPQEFLNHVKESLANYQTVSFDDHNLPADLSTEDGKLFLSLIYKALKPQEPEERKVVALKILTTVTTKTKKSVIINPLLSSKLWKQFCEQHRLYYRNNQQPVDPAFGDEYYMLLDHMLDRFKQELGLDNDNVETPFSKYWRAVKMKDIDKSKQVSNLVVLATNLQPDKPDIIGKFKTEILGSADNPSHNNRMRTLCEMYRKKTSNFPFFTKSDNLTAADCFQAKREFFHICEKEFYFGDCNDKDYDLLREIVTLEEKKSSLIGGSRVRAERHDGDGRPSMTGTQGARLGLSPVPEPRRDNSVGPAVARQVDPEPRSVSENRIARPQTPQQHDQYPVAPTHTQSIPMPPLLSAIPANPANNTDSLDRLRNSFQPLLMNQTQSAAQTLRPPTQEIKNDIVSNPVRINPPKPEEPAALRLDPAMLSPGPSPYDLNASGNKGKDFVISSRPADQKPAPTSQSKYAIFGDYPATRQPVRPSLIKDPVLEELNESKSNRIDHMKSPPESAIKPLPGASSVNPSPIIPNKLNWNQEDEGNRFNRLITFNKPTEEGHYSPFNNNNNGSFAREPESPKPNPASGAPSFRTSKIELKQSRVDQISSMKFQDIGRFKSLCYLPKGKLYENDSYKAGVSCFKQVDPKGEKQLLIQCVYEPLPEKRNKMALFQLSYNDYKLSAHPDESYVEIPVKEFFQNNRYPVLQIDQRDPAHKIISKEIPVMIPVSKAMFIRPGMNQLAEPNAINTLKRMESDWYMLDHKFFKGPVEIVKVFKGLHQRPDNPDIIVGDFDLLGMRYPMSIEIFVNSQGEFKTFIYYNKMESESKAKAFANELILLLVDPTTL